VEAPEWRLKLPVPALRQARSVGSALAAQATDGGDLGRHHHQFGLGAGQINIGLGVFDGFLGRLARQVGPLFVQVFAANRRVGQNGDIERLMSCWSDEEDIVCVHPGGPRVLGALAIRATFESMFTNGTIQAHPRRLRKVESLTSAVHSVIETIQILTPDGPREAYVTATNVYHRTAQGWRLVVHHASPGTESDAPEIEDAPQVLH